MTVTVNVQGVEFTVEGTYIPACRGSFATIPYSEPSGAEFEINTISIGDQDVTEFLTDGQYNLVVEEAYTRAENEYNR